MKKLLSLFVIAVTFTVFSTEVNADTLELKKEIITQAQKLLVFHYGEDVQMSVDEEVKEIPSFQNPSDKKQKFQVFEVWGYIYKAKYRMRFIYYKSENTYILMGQEILEFAVL